MDSKTLATLMIVFVCVLLFPVAIGIIGGVFGVVGGVIGAVFGAIAGVFGAIIGVIAAIFGALFGAIGWLFDDHFYPWSWAWNDHNNEILAILAAVLIVVLMSRSKRQRSGRSPMP